MSTAVAVTSHGHMLPPPDRYTPRAHVFGPPGEHPLEAALTEMHALIEQHGHVVVVYPSALPTGHVHRLHSIRSVLESDRIALLPVPLPPLGTGVLARQLRQLSLCDFSPGVLGGAGRLLAHYIYSGARLASVAGLDHVPVPLAAHAKSWLPGAQFAVLASPEPQLVPLGGGREQPAALPGPRFATQLTVARGQLDAGWVTGSLAAEWRVQGLRDAPLPADSPEWWGTSRLVEFTAAIPDVSVLYQLVSSVRRDRCHWCGLELLGDHCTFCAAPARPGPESTGTAVPARSDHAVVADPRGLRP